MHAVFTLRAGSPAIDPLTQAVRVQVGSYQLTIPAGSYQANRDRGPYRYSGVIGNTAVSSQIVQQGNGQYQFMLSASPADTSGLTSPAAVTVSIGGNTGSARATF